MSVLKSFYFILHVDVQLFPQHVLKKNNKQTIFFSNKLSFLLCQVSVNYIYVRYMFSILLIYISVLSPVPHFLGHWCFVVCLKTVWCQSNFAHLLQYWISCSGPFVSRYNFKISVSITVEFWNFFIYADNRFIVDCVICKCFFPV